jgi:hypothetical protein
MEKSFFLILLSILLIGSQSCGQKAKTGDLAVIDIARSYPQKEIILQDIADIEYIPLETTDDILLGQYSRISFVSDKYIVIHDFDQGDIFAFNRNGRIASHFNHRGPGDKEYNRIANFVFDEKNEEVFVFDVSSSQRRILVYSLSGEYRRTLNYPEDLNITGYNFDDETLLVYDINGLMQDAYSETPYLFLSKKDGSFVSGLEIVMPVRYSNSGVRTFTDENGQQMTGRVTFSTTNNMHFGHDLVITDMSSDTIFKLTKNKELTPIAVRTPSVHAAEPRTVWGTNLITDKFIIVNKFTLDFNTTQLNQRMATPIFYYEFNTGETSDVSFINDDFPAWEWRFDSVNIPQKNVAVRMMQLYTLKDALEEKKLKGKLEQLVASLDDDDNPVIMIVKFK